MTDSSRVLSATDGAVTTITINRPDRMNALDSRTLAALDDAFARAAADAAVRAVIVTGTGRAFSAGADVKEWASGDAGGSDAPADGWVTLAHRLISRVYRLPKPVVAAVNGVAVGGGFDLALACDFRIGADTSRYGAVYVNIGFAPDAGGTFLLPRIVGMTRAKELIYTGRIIDAAEAAQIGVVSSVVPGSELTAASRELAGRLAAGPSVAIGLAKENIQDHWNSTLESALRNESRAGSICGATADHAEGLQAVNEKRPPQFTGR
jgi:2-(1,2-epoxy-1,2-dihydrophenyl)acetyl-CoA isomerase